MFFYYNDGAYSWHGTQGATMVVLKEIISVGVILETQVVT